MTDNPHFEDLWCNAEAIHAKSPIPRAELYIQLSEDLKEYQKFDAVPSKEIQGILKTKKLGEIIFKLTELSRIDDVNTFTALQLEIETAKKRLE